MFDSLTERLSTTLKRLRGEARLTEENISDTLREIRLALLEADVALPVVRALTDTVRERALGQDVLRSLTPGQALVKVVHDQLVQTMGAANEGLSLN
ncbi:MAG TPA: signal recognition particle receptor subunit alpha, partial [Gammaproteobacteria bacterium]|nr:signal recognition particle receptor subunit alpha [Gammaproteobacteria bacterium]